MADNFKSCSVDGCNGNAHRSARGCRGWCHAHYRRWYRHGDPLAGNTSRGAVMDWLVNTAIPHQSDECLDWPFAKISGGYGEVKIGGKITRASRWLCEKVHGPAPTPKHEAAHSCGNGHLGCINHRHLRWATPKENNADKLVHGTHHRGERCPTAKLTESDVLKIRQLVASGETHRAVAERFPVGPSNVGLIASGHRWGWLRPESNK